MEIKAFSKSGQGFVLSDPCYVLDEDLYNKFIDKIGYSNYGGTININGSSIGYINVPEFNTIGDKSHQQYMVDSGLFAAIPVDLITNKDIKDIIYSGQYCIIEYSKVRNNYVDCGDIFITVDDKFIDQISFGFDEIDDEEGDIDDSDIDDLDESNKKKYNINKILKESENYQFIKNFVNPDDYISQEVKVNIPVNSFPLSQLPKSPVLSETITDLRESIINFARILEGIRERLKEIHWNTSVKSIHLLTDDFITELGEFQDSLVEEMLGITDSKINFNEFYPVFCEPQELNEVLKYLLTNIMNVKSKYTQLNDKIEYGGINSILDDMLHYYFKGAFLETLK